MAAYATFSVCMNHLQLGEVWSALKSWAQEKVLTPVDGMSRGRKRKRRWKSRDRLTFLVARPGGFEPPAKSLEGSCSIHLSYERVLSL